MGFIHAWLFVVGHWELALAVVLLVAACFVLPIFYPPAVKICAFVLQYWYLVAIVILLILIHGVDQQASTAERYMIQAKGEVAQAAQKLQVAVDANRENEETIARLQNDAKEGVLSLNKLLADKDAQIAAINEICSQPAEKKSDDAAPKPGKRKSTGLSLGGLRKYELQQLGPHR